MTHGEMGAVRKAKKKLVEQVLQMQAQDGRWMFCFETGPMTDAYTLLLMESFRWRDPRLREGLVERLRSLLDEDGGWRLYTDEPQANLSATLEASVALVATGAETIDGVRIRRAQEQVRSQGGVGKAGALTRMMLCLTGLLDWRHQLHLPLSFLLLPRWFPIHFFDLVGFTRCHLVPTMVASHLRIARKLFRGPHDLSGWGSPSVPGKVDPALQAYIRRSLPVELSESAGNRLALAKAALFMRNRTESDGTLYSYFSTTLFMIYAWLGMGCSPGHPWITQAIRGLRSFIFPVRSGLHMQFTTSSVWDTALLLDALGEAGIPPDHPAMEKGRRYILARQQTRLGDWALNNPGVLAGGWGFSHINTIHPDLDDTAACLRVIARALSIHPSLDDRWERGVRWLTSMQNRDGGWSAFEKNLDKTWSRLLLPAKDLQRVATDPSTPDLTGRVLAFLGRHRGWKPDHPAAKRAIRYLEREQQPNGSWLGRWGIAYIYGTWAALTGMAAVGCSPSHPAVAKGIRWILSIQNSDGGWGESCRSDWEERYIPLQQSTPSQTAWALDALIAYHDRPNAAIRAGVKRLAKMVTETGAHITYPTGAGLAGQFYIHYHSYRWIWPLGVLARYEKKYGNAGE